jgi:sulfate transport system substrate-binding protein
VALTTIGCSRGVARRESTVTIRLAGYTAAREVYGKGIIPAFAKAWKDRTGQDVLFEESYDASFAQAQAIVAGSEADVAALALEPDVDTLVQAGLVDPDWRYSETGGVFSQSLVVLAVRAGNPLAIRDWDDLAKPGVRVETPDPRTSGSGRWNVCAIYGAALRGYAGARRFRSDDASALLARIFRNVGPMDRGARESISAFERGTGDVAITYESEAIAGAQSGQAIDYVIPHSTLIIELPVAMVRKNVDRHGTRQVVEAFLQFLKGEDAQRQFAAFGLRPVDPRIVEDTRSKMRPTEDLWPIGFLGGWSRAHDDVFSADGVFTKIYESLFAAE